MITDLSALREYAIKECKRDGVQSHAVDLEDAFFFMQDLDPKEMSVLEHEMALMHAASIIDEANEFADNFNVRPALHNRYIDHVSFMMNSDTATWCRKLDSFSFWPTANRRVANLAWNWLNNTLDAPEVLV